MASKRPSQKPLKSDDTRLGIEERDQANKLVATYIKSSKDGFSESSRIDVIIPENTNTYAKSILYAFLPAGYPESVTKDYLDYQIYDSLQAFSSSIAGLLSSRAVLEGIGVGDSHASPTAALLLSVLQDSMGRIATILFAHRLGTSLEPECKMYRLAADIFNDAAMLLDCLSPAFPKSSRVVLLSLSSVLRSLCGVAAGSSKASLSAHFATQGNLGELNAKDSSQETIISLMGMLAGSLVVSYISSQWATWSAMIALLAIHLGTNYMAVRSVSMRTLNRQRANLVLSNLLHQMKELKGQDKEKVIFPTPEEISVQERIFERNGVLRWKGDQNLGYCQIGVDFRKLIDLLGTSDKTTGSYKTPQPSAVTQLLDIFKDQDYIMLPDVSRRRFLIVLKESANTESQLRAWMHALWFAAKERSRLEQGEGLGLDAIAETLSNINNFTQALDVFDKLQQAGWDIDTGAIETKSGTRIRIS